MKLDVGALYEPLLHRDADGARAAITHALKTSTSDEVFEAVVRFTLLAFTPSEHGRASLLAVVAARDLGESSGERRDELTAECAIYSASVRAPWSEPPIADPPAIDDAQSDSIDEIRLAIEGKDRLRGERWLAKVIRGERPARRFFEAAALTLPRGTHDFVTTMGVWRVAERVPEQFRFASLRVAVAAWTAGRSDEEPATRAETTGSIDAMARRMASAYERGDGSPLEFRRIALFDAALAVRSIDACADIGEEALHYCGDDGSPDRLEGSVSDTPLPVYSLARDYATYLQAVAIQERLRRAVDNDALARIRATAYKNLENAESFEEWSLA